MRYITKDDLVEVIKTRLLDDSIGDGDTMLDSMESKAIDFVVSYIGGTYDTDSIFSSPVKRNGLLVYVISRLVVYWAVRRNAARKVPEDYIDLYSNAISLLGKIQEGSLALDGLPKKGAEGGKGSLLYGNTAKDDFFI